MNITLSGLAGTGTTTVGNLLAKRLGMSFVSSGEIFRNHAKSRGMSLAEYGKLCEEDPETDRMIDLRQEELSTTMDNTIFEGRITGFKCTAGLKVLLFAPTDIRVQRVAVRENESVNEAKRKMLEREASEAKRYKKYYAIDVNDTSIYDLAIDTSKASPEEIVRMIVEEMKKKSGTF